MAQQKPYPLRRVGIIWFVTALISLWAWWPAVQGGLPYFYNEDEAHHFNRTVNMVKRGDFNPHYFLKPSLHFYLRMPLVATSFIWEVRQGRARTLDDIVTADPHGIGGYALSASHPTMVKASRLLSVAAMLGALGCALWVISLAANAALMPLLAASVVWLLSPALLVESPVVGVDPFMTWWAGLALAAGVTFVYRPSLGKLALTVIAAGAAVSTKYNALPIILIPLVAALVGKAPSGKRWQFVALGVVGPWVAFLAGSPFILAEIPLFLNHLAYEVWHYGVAGHDGHMGEPGFAQALFYLRWWDEQGVGVGGLVLALVGFVGLLWSNFRIFCVVAVFPVVYFVLMCSQKANFERNMLVLTPWVVVAIGLGVAYLARWKKVGRGLVLLCLTVVTWQQSGRFLAARGAYATQVESRIEFRSWFKSSEWQVESEDVAVAAQLRFENTILDLPGVAVVEDLNPLALRQVGFSWVVLQAPISSDYWELVKSFPGISSKERITRNPALYVYKARNGATLCEELSATPPPCIPGPTESHCWISSLSALLSPPPHGRVRLMSPWPGQELEIRSGKLTLQRLTLVPGQWTEANLPPSDNVKICLSRVSSPRERGVSSDGRRLGVAVASVD